MRPFTLRNPDLGFALRRSHLTGAMVSQNDASVTHFPMKTFISSENDFEEYKEKFPEDVTMIHFKLVGIGPNTMANAGYLGSNICKIVREQPGFFVVSQDGSGLREAMHDLVDRFCDARED